jgi:hypothetical protein
MTDKDEIALGMLALKHAMDRIMPAQQELRARANELLKKKERIPIELDGETVGVITKSSPKKKARINDEVKLLAWMQEHYPDCIDVVAYIEDMPKVIDALEQHAPNLVHYREVVDPTMMPKLLAAAEEVGAPIGPGGEADVPGIVVDTPDGNTSVIPDKANAYLIEQLFTQGRVSLDGTVQQQIEGAIDGVR